MSYFISLSEQAEIDLDETNSYYSQISNDLRDRFWTDLNSAMEKLVENPLHC